MAIAHPHFQAGEYVMLTRPYLGLPAGSVGMITERHSTPTPTPCYLVYFGESLPIGPFPETALIRLGSAGARVKSVPLG